MPGPDIVRFEPVKPDAFEVKITDESGGLAKAGLRTGDVIVGADGEEFENLRHAQALLMGAMAREKAKLLIQRGGTRFEVEIEGKKMMEGGPKAMGARLEPVAR